MRHKLTMVSIWHRGIRHVAFLNLPVSADGKTRIPEDMRRDFINSLHIPAGDCFALGM
jgi:hypothetical protein